MWLWLFCACGPIFVLIYSVTFKTCGFLPLLFLSTVIEIQICITDYSVTCTLFQVLFSSYIQKTNRFNKSADRALLITDSNIYKLETRKFKAMRKGSPIQEVLCGFWFFLQHFFFRSKSHTSCFVDMPWEGLSVKSDYTFNCGIPSFMRLALTSLL